MRLLLRNRNILFLTVISTLSLYLSGRAEVIDAAGGGGAFYEVEEAREGHHWFHIVPAHWTNGGGTATVQGSKDGKVILVFRIENTCDLKSLTKAQGVNGAWKAYSFGVNLDAVDELRMVEFLAAQKPPGGTIITTDLLKLVEMAKRDGHYKRCSQSSPSENTGRKDDGNAQPGSQ